MKRYLQSGARCSRRELAFRAIGASLAFALPARPLAAQGADAGPDSGRDPRLARRVRVRAEGVPLSRVLRELSSATGIRLEAPGRVGDERLVAFVPGTPLAEVMQSIAELYRCTWTRGSGDRPAYRLSRPAPWEREEQALRDRAFRQALDGLVARLRTPDRLPEGRQEREGLWSPVYPELLPLIAARLDELAREGYVYLPVGALPQPARGGILGKLQPALRQHDERRAAWERSFQEEWKEKGIQPEELKPPSNAERCTLTVDFNLGRTLRIMTGLRTDSETWYNWFEVHADLLDAEAMALYSAPRSRTGTAGQLDPLARVVPLPPAPAGTRPGQDWIRDLGRLSDATGVPLYADCYDDHRQGYSSHPRAGLVLPDQASVEQVLNRLAVPPGGSLGEGEKRGGFWWRRGDAALLRTRDWLWHSTATLPTALIERLVASLRKSGQLDPGDLPAIASLSALQLQVRGTLTHHMDHWHHAVRVPAQLSPPARQMLLTSGISWEKLPAPDRELLVRLVPHLLDPNRPSYDAKVFFQKSQNPAQGGTLLTLLFRAPEAPGGVPLHLPLAGYGPGPVYAETGLSVDVRPG